MVQMTVSNTGNEVAESLMWGDAPQAQQESARVRCPLGGLPRAGP